jgi:HSP20 family molecular chaperone IbpA
MELQKLNPWNWFKHEQHAEHTIPVEHRSIARPVADFHHAFDRAIHDMISTWGLPRNAQHNALQPHVDVTGNPQNYQITMEVPSLQAEQLHIQIDGNQMAISGQVQKELEHKNHLYYRTERYLGRFQRILSLPADVDTEATAVVIGGISLFGGRGSILGMLFGALTVGVLGLGLRVAGADPQWTYLWIGSLMIAAVTIDQWIRRAASWTS